MIGYLKGLVLSTDLRGRVLVDVQGVGYEVFSPIKEDYFFKSGTDVEFWIYTYAREDTLSLYGFLSEGERAVFISLIGISGIGPKSALSILSHSSYTQLMEHIESEDITALSRLPKVGKKTAHQMILSLKGKLSSEKTQKQDQEHKIRRRQVSLSLERLGFKPSELRPVLDQLDMKESVKEGIRKALSILQNI